MFRSSRATALLLAAALAAAGCGNGIADPVADGAVVRPVEILPVAAASPGERMLPARVVASTSTPLAFEVGGRLGRIDLRAGQRVAAGEVLAELDPETYRLALRDARARLERLQTERTRKRELFEQEILSGAAAQQLDSDIEIARVAVAVAERKLAHTTLRAPSAARIGRRLVDSFAMVAAGEPVLLLQEPDSVDVALQLPGRLAASLPLDERLAATASLPGETRPLLDLRYREHDTAADPLTGTYRLLLRAPAPEDLRLLPGMALEVRLALPAHPDQQRSRIPLTALQAAADGSHFVWRVNLGDGSVARLPVNVSRLERDSAILEPALPPGTQLVGAGARFLRDGDRVRPLAR